jgi:hypothetical protein
MDQVTRETKLLIIGEKLGTVKVDKAVLYGINLTTYSLLQQLIDDCHLQASIGGSRTSNNKIL